MAIGEDAVLAAEFKNEEFNYIMNHLEFIERVLIGYSMEDWVAKWKIDSEESTLTVTLDEEGGLLGGK